LKKINLICVLLILFSCSNNDTVGLENNDTILNGQWILNPAKKSSQKTIKKNILTIVKTIKKASPETKMFLQTILPTSKKIYNLKIESINNFLKKNQQKSLYQIVDLYSIFVNDKGYIKEGLTTDGIHINEKGYEKWAKYIKPLIKDL
jgi:lysophospholipase L1-like esterase